jgi:hypothetical protein
MIRKINLKSNFQLYLDGVYVNSKCEDQENIR